MGVIPEAMEIIVLEDFVVCEYGAEFNWEY